MGHREMRHLRTNRPRPSRQPEQREKRASLSSRALRGLGGFLALMALFTLLSRAADELTIPRVTLAAPGEGSIDRTMKGYGKVEELSAQAVTTQPGIRVAGIGVKPGAAVEQGDPLFTLDMADLEEKLGAAREALDRQDMDMEDRASQESLAAQDRAKALERANQDYAAAQASADREVERGKKALDQAKAKLNAAPPPVGDLAALEAACAQASAALKAAEEELARLENEIEEKVREARQNADASPEEPDSSNLQVQPAGDGEPETPDQREARVRAEYQPALDAAKEKVEAARQAKAEAEAALAAYQENAAEAQMLRDAVDAAQQSYDQAVESRNNVLRSAARQIEDAQRPQAQDSSRKKAQMDRDRQALQVSRLESLIGENGIVRSPAAGTVTGLYLTVGAATPEGAAVLLAGEGNGSVFTAQVSADQEKYLSPGDEAVIKPGGGREPLEELVVESVVPNPGDVSLLDVTVRLPEGALAIGTAGELEVRRKSQDYPCRVPLSALHEENGAYFLLVTKEKAGLLGTELCAARLDVAVLEKNETYAAIEQGALDWGQKFLAGSTKPVSAGDRIRLEVQ